MATLATLAATLVFLVIVTSAYLRLRQAGLGCAEWPACYGVAQPPETGADWVRGGHRLAAAAVGVLVAIIAVAGISAGRYALGITRAAVLLVALTVFLAVLGRVTPGAALPAVTLGNVLGGMAMLGLLWWLRLQATAPPIASRGRLAPWAWLGLTVLAVQIALGVLVSARLAALACATFPDCDGAWWPQGATLAAFDPFDSAGATAMDDPARKALQMAHRYGAFLAAVYLAALGARALCAGGPLRNAGAAILALMLMQTGLGALALRLGFPLASAVAHNAGAALLLLAVTHLAQRARPAAPP